MDLLPGYISSIFHSILWAASCIGMGRLVIRNFFSLTKLEKLIVSFLIGVIVWIFIFYILAIFHGFTPLIIRILVYIISIGSIVSFGREWWKDFRNAISPDWKTITLLVILIVQGLYSLMPVVSFDATLYHLPLAQHLLDHGTISWTPFIFNTAFPKNYEVLQAIGLAIGADASASLVSWFFSIGTVLCLVAIGNRVNKTGIGIWAGIAISITPLWFELGHVPMNEVGMAFGISVLLLVIIIKAPGWLVGIAIGWIAGMKYYGIEAGVLAFVIWIIQAKPGWKQSYTVIGISILITGFWYARNIWLFSNPIFPYGADLFSFMGTARAYGADDVATNVVGQFDQFSSPTTLTGWLTSPFRLMLKPSPDFIENDYAAWKWVGWLAFFWPFAIFTLRKTGRALRGAWAFLFISTLMWILVHKIIYLRFLTPLLPFMYLFSFITVSAWLKNLKLPPVTMKILTIIACLIALVHLMGPTTYDDLFLLPLSSFERDEHISLNIEEYPIINEINQLEPSPTVYFLYGEYNRHYCDFELYSGWRDPYGFWKFEEKATSGEELAEWLEEIGIDILLIKHKRQHDISDDLGLVLLEEGFTSIYRPAFLKFDTSVFIRRDSNIVLPVESGPGTTSE